MITRSSAFAILASIALLGAGCSSTSTVSTSPAPVAPRPNAPAPSSMVGACEAVNTAMIKQHLGLTVSDGQSQPSGMQGTTCIFSGAGIVPDSVNVQFSPKADVYYSANAWEGSEAITGYATGNLRGPNDGSLSAAVVKNGKLALVTVYTMNNSVTKEQFTNLLKAIAGQF